MQVIYVQCNTKARSRNNYGRGKTIRIIYSEYVFVALVNQHTKRMRHCMLPFVASLAVPYFLHNFFNGTIFGRMYLNIICVFRIFLQNLTENFSFKEELLLISP